LGKSERDAVRSQIRRIVEHLLKLAHSPAEPPRNAWMEAIDDAREVLSDKMSPTLRRDAEQSVDRLYAEGLRRAERGLRRHREADTADALPRTPPFSLDDVCREDWYPGRQPAHSAEPHPVGYAPRTCGRRRSRQALWLSLASSVIDSAIKR
jgi:hypothetical protein